MEELINSLNRISHWLEDNEPEIADISSPSINRTLIDSDGFCVSFYFAR